MERQCKTCAFLKDQRRTLKARQEKSLFLVKV
jgi:hypothetical protein